MRTVTYSCDLCGAKTTEPIRIEWPNGFPGDLDLVVDEPEEICRFCMDRIISTMRGLSNKRKEP